MKALGNLLSAAETGLDVALANRAEAPTIQREVEAEYVAQMQQWYADDPATPEY